MKNLVKRSAALLFVLVMVMSMMVVPASAAYGTKDIANGKVVRAVINTGNPTNNWSYWTMIIVQNTGKNAVSIWEPGNFWENEPPLFPGRSIVIYVKGKNANHTVKLQASYGNTSVAISTVERGKISWKS